MIVQVNVHIYIRDGDSYVKVGGPTVGVSYQ